MKEVKSEGSEPPDPKALIEAVAGGDAASRDALLELVYSQLRATAQRALATERPGHTLSATALVHEAFLRLMGPREVTWVNRAHFYATAAEAMRRVLLDHAKHRGREKRGGSRERVPLGESACIVPDSEDNSVDHVSVDRAICRLREVDADMAELVKLRYYAGLSCEEVALAIGVTEKTVRNRWKFASAWLAKALEANA